MPENYEIRLVVNKKEEGYNARWIDPDGESEDFPLVLPLSSDDMAEIRWYLEEFAQFAGAGDRARAEEDEKKLEEWGDKLFEAFFGDNMIVYFNLMTASRDKRCLLTIGSDDPNVLGHPWELMRDRTGPLALRGITFRRQLKGSGLTRHYEFGLPLRILLIVSRPEDIGFIDPRNSIAPMMDALDDLPKGQVIIDFCDPPTMGQLDDLISKARIAKQPYHIVHFDGHGTYRDDGVGVLAFEKDNGKNDPITGPDLGELLARLEVPLVILEACRSSALSDAYVFGSVAPALVEKGVGSVVAFSHAVHIHAARLLVERFYRRLVDGVTIGQALDEGRSRLRSEPARWLHLGPNADSVDLQDWFIPQLYQMGGDLALIKADSPSVSLDGAEEDKEKIYGFPHPPAYSFHGRAMELLELERAFRKYLAVVVSGMGGMGKTALAREAAAWWLKTGRFDSAVFCSFENRAGAEQVVQDIGKALEGEDFISRPSEKQWKDAVQLFHKNRVLLVWDNFESTLPIWEEKEESALSFGPKARESLLKLYYDLIEGKPSGRLLVTCRPVDTGLPGIKEIHLKGLARHDSLHLLNAVLELKSITKKYERPEMEALLGALADHPLSIELVAPRLDNLTPEEILRDFRPMMERFSRGDAFEQRNSSLLASLEFSTKHLSKEAHNMLPYLAWFRGGVFEFAFLDFAQIDPQDWSAIRNELAATALVTVENYQWINSPYLRFHPTLPYAADPMDVEDSDGAEGRFVDVYRSVAEMANKALRDGQPTEAMVLLSKEEGNIRSGIGLALKRGDSNGAWAMARTLLSYLDKAGRLREHNGLVEWIQTHLPKAEKLDIATCENTQKYAWSRFTQGYADEGIAMIEDLIHRLETEGMADDREKTYELGLSYMYLGRIYDHSGRSRLALAPLEKGKGMFEKLGDEGLGDLANVLGDLANAYMSLGLPDDALKAAQDALIDRAMGNNLSVAAGIGQIAQILMTQEKYGEADARYEEALKAARDANDINSQVEYLSNWGILKWKMEKYDRALELYREAIKLSQRSGSKGDEMQICNMLGAAEFQRGQLAGAEAWYNRSRELAIELKDWQSLAAAAQNLGILYQTRGEKVTDPQEKSRLLNQALESVEEGLKINLELGDEVNAASSYGQLGDIYRMLGELDRAEENVKKSMTITESLKLPDVWKDYDSMAEIARAKGDEKAASQWEAKRDAKREELRRLASGMG